MTRHDVFDTVGGTYRSAAALPIPLAGPGLAVLDGKLLIAGGEHPCPGRGPGGDCSATTR